jgi:hypothetical protein
MLAFQRLALVCSCAVLVAGVSFASAPDVVARLDNYDGTVTVVRAGAPVKASLVDTGFAFENNDEIKVSNDGSADISVDTKTGIKANLHLKASTTVLLDLSSLATQGQKGALDLLSGSLSLKVQKMVGANGLEVHTETANMGVRGTVFNVDTEVDGSTLLTTDEGRVELTPEQGPHHFSVPGVAVRGDGDETSHWTEAQVSDSKAFIESWHTERFKYFEAHKEAVAGRIADRYERLSARFDAAYARLEQNKDLWDRWSAEENSGKRSPGLTDVRLRNRLQANLAALRVVSWSLERMHRRLGAMEARLGPEAFAQLKVKTASGDWGEFVHRWHSERANLETRLAVGHYRVKLFALRHGGRLLWLKRGEAEGAEAPEPVRRR